ncbi:MAG: SCO family protein [Rhodomicrobium sp.]|nr:SCO family protein [Rhodomicrobium sp.]
MRDFLGKPSIVLFGFTGCPSICPTAMAELAKRLDALGPLTGRLNVLFVSADPENDTPEILRDYTASFHADIVGLTGTPDNIAALAKSLGAVIRKVPQQDGGYMIEHTVFAFMMDRNWRRSGILVLDPGVDPARTDERLRAFAGGRRAAGGLIRNRSHGQEPNCPWKRGSGCREETGSPFTRGISLPR